MKLKAILFDLDMTLVDSSALYAARWLGRWAQVLSSLHQIKDFQGHSVAASELPGRLRAVGYRIGIVTTSPRNYAEAVLAKFGIPYDTLVAYQDTETHKPEPEPLIKALGNIGIAANEAAYVGDDVADVEACVHAGLTSIGAGWGVSDFEEFSSKAPDIWLTDPSQLLQPDGLNRFRYLAELGCEGQPGAAGAYLSCGRDRYALGRYFQPADKRHAGAALSKRLLEFKSSDFPANVLAQTLVGFLGNVGWQPNTIVAVPKKPSQARDRFSAIFQALKGRVGFSRIDGSSLSCVKEVGDYKTMGKPERAAAIAGAYAWVGPRLTGQVLLLDDVLTTGATADECQRVLYGAGATEIRTVAFGRSQFPMDREICICGRQMKIRTNNSTGEQFWGCTGYPDACKRTKRI